MLARCSAWHGVKGDGKLNITVRLAIAELETTLCIDVQKSIVDK
jgi:hypothetical protein